MAGRVCARGAEDNLDEHKEEEVGEVHRCECHSNIHTRVPVPKPEATRYGSEKPNEETAIEIARADPVLPARRLRQVGWSALWREGLRNVILPLPLPQQLALGTPQRQTRQEVRDRPSRTQSTPQSIKMYTTCRRDTKAMVGSRGRHPRPPVLSPRGTGDCQPSDPSQCTQRHVPPTRHTALHGVLDLFWTTHHEALIASPSTTGSALTKTASLKKEREQLWTQLEWARVWKSMSSVGDAENDLHSMRPRRGFFVRGQTGRSHIRAIWWALSPDFLCRVNPGKSKMSSSRPRAYGPRTRHLVQCATSSWSKKTSFL